MRVKMKPVKVLFEVIGRAGRLEYLRQVGSEWNNMVELQDHKGAKLILMRENGIMSQALSEVMGDGTSDWKVVSGAPSLLHTLDTPGLGDDIPCEKCGAVALDTGLECSECGHDNYPAVYGRPFGA